MEHLKSEHEFVAKSVPELLACLERLEASGCDFVFRGEAKHHCERKPLLYRSEPVSANILEIEKKLILDFWAEAKPFLRQEIFEAVRDEQSDAGGSGLSFERNLQIAAHARHYGLPTRLLDWTRDWGVALFFATLGGDTDGPRYIYCFAKLGLDQGLEAQWDSWQVHKIDDKRDSQRAWIPALVRTDIEFVCGWEYPARFRRLAQQRGLYTVGSNSVRGHDKLIRQIVRQGVGCTALPVPEGSGFWKITVPSDRVHEIREKLGLFSLVQHELVELHLDGIAGSVTQRHLKISQAPPCTSAPRP
jgi:hypothetical protein